MVPSGRGTSADRGQGFHVSIGLIALLDDVAAIAKVAAASLDDIGTQAMKAGAKAAGVVIDDAAVTPRYVTGFAAERELSIVGRIALGSVRNKLLFLLPAALALSFFAPWAITPLLMLGGLYLSYEGTEKVAEALFPHHAHGADAQAAGAATDPKALEDQKVSSAIKTDFILSAEIMAITLAAVPDGGFWTQAIVLAVVGIGITAAVYGGVALIVKADDAGVALAATRSPSGPGSAVRALGRGLVLGMPVFLKILAIVGTAAMIWVGGGIVVHGLEGYGLPWIARAIHDAALAVGHAVPWAAATVEWLVTAAGSGLVGLILGALLIPVVSYVLAPLARMVRPGKAPVAH
jgi:predicted DNA repair protein MutK